MRLRRLGFCAVAISFFHGLGQGRSGGGRRRRTRSASLALAGILACCALAAPPAAADDDCTPGTITTVAGGQGGGGALALYLYYIPAIAADGAGNLFIADSIGHRVYKVAPSGTLTTVAGTGTAGFSGDGGPAASASLYNPAGVVVDDAGNLFISDYSNSRIRKVDASGTITTVAGNGTSGFSGDGGPATAASFQGPRGLAVDGAGNLFITDTLNHRIRRVDASGTITTLAGSSGVGFGGDGGPATSAALYLPWDVATDGAGNVFIADSHNGRIRKVDASGTITTVAGGGASLGEGVPATSAVLSETWGVAVDGAGNLFIADFYSHRVRKVDASGTMTTAAGTGVHGYSGDGGPATSATLTYPTDVAVDGAGILFINDTGPNGFVRRLCGVASGFSTWVEAPEVVSRECEDAAGATVLVALEVGGAVPAGAALQVRDVTPGRTARLLYDEPALAGVVAFDATFPHGLSQVRAQVVRGSEVRAEASFTVVVEDTTPPVISGPGEATLVTDCAGSAMTVSPGVLSQTATDACDPDPTFTCSPAVLSPGVTTVVCRAVDADGNHSEKSVEVTVLAGPFEVAFQKPLDATVDNKFHVGSVVPIKVDVRCGGTLRTDVTATIDAAQRIDGAGGPVDLEVEDAGLSGDGGSRMRLSRDGTWIYNLSTKGWDADGGARFRVTVRIRAPGHVDTTASVVLKGR